jgi:hypothetical protein
MLTEEIKSLAKKALLLPLPLFVYSQTKILRLWGHKRGLKDNSFVETQTIAKKGASPLLNNYFSENKFVNSTFSF